MAPNEDKSWLKVGSALASFAIGFCVVAGIVHLSIGNKLRLHADQRSEKLMVMDEWQGRAYSAAFGSSHMHHGFDPRAFDLAMEGTPLQTRSLNLAILGGSQAEQRATALAFVENLQPPARMSKAMESQACMVVLELTAGANFTNNHLIHPRAINIYDWQTVRFISKLTSPEMGLTQRVGRVGFAVVAMVLHYSNVGMLSSSIFAPPMDEEMLRDETIEDRRGIFVLPQTPKLIKDTSDEIKNAPRKMQRTEERLLPGNRSLLEDLQAASRVRNLNMVYVVMPKLSDLESYPIVPESIGWSGGTVPIFNMARPDLYPDLYQPQYWFDEVHLSERGAGYVTKTVADNLKSWYAVHGMPSRCGG